LLFVRSASTSEDSETQEDEIVIVDHASSDQEKAEITKDESPEKKGGWMSGWFGGQTHKTDDHESRSHPDGAEGGSSSSDVSNKPKKAKSEHVVVPNKGNKSLFP